MIPGPIEFHPDVITAMGQPTFSHVAPDFIASYGRALEMMKQVWQAPNGMPFAIAGSGTLAMDMAACNLIEAGDRVLVISTGYFGARYVDLLTRYGAEVTVLTAEIGDVVPMEKIEDELKNGGYKLMTMTHVDTSTGVLVNPKPLAKLAKEHGVLSILDGVCSVAGEEINQEEWGIDIVITASQKAIGVPPGLALLVASQKAIDVWQHRKSPVANYYCDWGNWLPIMQAYMERRPSYFATPAVNLVQALEKSLDLILLEGLETRFNRHKQLASKFRTAMKRLGLSFIPENDEICANTLTAPYYPEGVSGPDFLKKVGENGVIVAGGLLPDLKSKYFRVGHMGIVSNDHIDRTISAIKAGLNN